MLPRTLLARPQTHQPANPYAGSTQGADASRVAGSQSFTPFASLPAFFRALVRRGCNEIRQALSSPQSPAIRPPFDTCVSYDSATTTRQIRHLPDTKQLLPDTESVECPYLPVDTVPSNMPAPDPDEIRQPTSPSGKSPMRPICQLRPRYGHETNETPSRYKQTRFSYGERLTPLLGVATPPVQDWPSAPRRNPPTRPAPATSSMRLNRQLPPSYDHATDATPPATNIFVSATKSVARPYLARDTALPEFAPRAATKSANPIRPLTFSHPKTPFGPSQCVPP